MEIQSKRNTDSTEFVMSWHNCLTDGKRSGEERCKGGGNGMHRTDGNLSITFSFCRR